MFKQKFFFLYLCLKTLPVFCLYLGNPASPSMPQKGFFIKKDVPVSLKVSYAKDHVFTKNFKKDASLALTRNANLGVVTLNWTGYLELYGAAGQEKIGFKNEKAHLLKEAVLDWSIGGKAILIEWGKVALCTTGAYLTSYPNPDNHRNTYNEWEIGLGLARNIEYFSLYALGGFSKAYYSLDHQIALKNTNPFLLALGASFFTKKAFVMNGELRFFGETALGFDFAFRF